MNLRLCQKSKDQRHNFAGGVCLNFCGVRQEDLMPKKKEKVMEIKPSHEDIKARNERDYWVKKTAILLSKTSRSVYFITLGWPVESLRDHYLEAEKKDNPAQFWWGIIKWWKQKNAKNAGVL